MQAGAEVVAVQVGDLEVDQPEGMRAVDEHLDAVRVGHVGDLATGISLAHPVDHVGDVDEPGARRDGLLVGLHDRVSSSMGKSKLSCL